MRGCRAYCTRWRKVTKRLQIQFRISRSFRPRNLANLGSKIRFWIRRKEHTLTVFIYFPDFPFFFRETLLGQLTVYIKGIRDDFITKTQNSYSGNKDGSGPPKGRNMPEIVNNIVWVRQLDSKVWFQTITVNIFSLHLL